MAPHGLRSHARPRPSVRSKFDSTRLPGLSSDDRRCRGTRHILSVAFRSSCHTGTVAPRRVSGLQPPTTLVDRWRCGASNASSAERRPSPGVSYTRVPDCRRSPPSLLGLVSDAPRRAAMPSNGLAAPSCLGQATTVTVRSQGPCRAGEWVTARPCPSYWHPLAPRPSCLEAPAPSRRPRRSLPGQRAVTSDVGFQRPSRRGLRKPFSSKLHLSTGAAARTLLMVESHLISTPSSSASCSSDSCAGIFSRVRR